MDLFNNKNLYPTPISAIEQMLTGVDIYDKTILEPSAGLGNIVDYLKQNGAKDILCCEIQSELAQIVSKKARLILNDFTKVTSEMISHIDLIVMNPPFSADEQHILHAWEIAPEGCEIISLCNYETLSNNYTQSRKTLQNIIKDYGNESNLKDIFSTAERKTNIDIGLVHLFKPRKESNNEFEGYFDLDPDEESQNNGIMQYNEIRNIVNRYVSCVNMFNAVLESSKAINEMQKGIDNTNVSFGAFINTNSSYNSFTSIDRETYKKELQKSSWKTVFNKLKMDKYVTKSVMEDINKFVEQQQQVPFTMKNVYKMFEMIIGTQSSRMDRVIVESFEKICSYSADNSEARDVWKTNSNYKINKNIIIPYIVECSYSGGLDVHYDRSNGLDDIIKALCYITGSNYENQIPIRTFVSSRYVCINKECDNLDVEIYNKSYCPKCNKKTQSVNLEFGKWYKWNDFFEIKGYKKGTLHLRFIDDDAWFEFNRQYSRIKGWRVPEKTNNKTTGKERKK